MIEKVILKNFKCFENIDLEFSQLNLFTGINGMGKSTLIQAILLLRQTYERNGLIKDESIILNGHYVNVGTTKDISYWYKKDDNIQIIIQEENKIWQCDFDMERNKLVLTKTNELHEKSVFTSRGFEYISAERLGPRRYYDSLESEVYHVNQVGAKGENTLACLYGVGSDFKVYRNMQHPSEKSERLDMQVDAWMSEISPGIKIKTIPYLDVNLMGLRYSTSTLMGEESASAVNMGFGVSYVLPIIVSLLKAQKGDLLIIENPEAHLHPKGQRRVGELVALAAANGVQVIMETHSDHVLNGIRLAVKEKKIMTEQTKINYFYEFVDTEGMPRHEKTSPEILGDGSLSNWPEGFFDEWDSFVISFPSQELWAKDWIEGDYVSLQEEDLKVSVRNAGTCEQVVAIEEEEKEYSRLHISSGRELWDKREELYPHLIFCQSVKKQMEEARVSLQIKNIMQRIQILEDYFKTYTGIFDKEKLGYGCRYESDSVQNDEQLKNMRKFKTPYGTEEYFYWHISFPGNYPGRIHFFPDPEHRVGIIGYVGKHLPTKRYHTI